MGHTAAGQMYAQDGQLSSNYVCAQSALQLTAVRLSVCACVCPVFTMHNDSICELTLDKDTDERK